MQQLLAFVTSVIQTAPTFSEHWCEEAHLDSNRDYYSCSAVSTLRAPSWYSLIRSLSVPLWPPLPPLSLVPVLLVYAAIRRFLEIISTEHRVFRSNLFTLLLSEEKERLTTVNVYSWCAFSRLSQSSPRRLYLSMVLNIKPRQCGENRATVDTHLLRRLTVALLAAAIQDSHHHHGVVLQ